MEISLIPMQILFHLHVNNAYYLNQQSGRLAIMETAS